jgi:hypothetical protein
MSGHAAYRASTPIPRRRDRSLVTPATSPPARTTRRSHHVNDTTPEGLGALDERRCWRCLQMFPGDADRGTPMRNEFWLCDPCEAALLPSTQRG